MAHNTDNEMMITIQIITTLLSWLAAWLFTRRNNIKLYNKAPYAGVLAGFGWIYVLGTWEAWPLLVCEIGFFIIYIYACVNHIWGENGTDLT